MKLRLRYFIFLLSFFCSINADAVPITITGKVQDETGKPLSGVSVTLKGSTTGTTTGSNGIYTLSLQNDKGTIVISYIGFTHNRRTC